MELQYSQALPTFYSSSYLASVFLNDRLLAQFGVGAGEQSVSDIANYTASVLNYLHIEELQQLNLLDDLKPEELPTLEDLQELLANPQSIKPLDTKPYKLLP